MILYWMFDYTKNYLPILLIVVILIFLTAMKNIMHIHIPFFKALVQEYFNGI